MILNFLSKFEACENGLGKIIMFITCTVVHKAMVLWIPYKSKLICRDWRNLATPSMVENG